ncbi:transcription termination/antitermination protein NusA [Candidatus Parcubacteria bacterium]|nr:transcription termination/antitermination protein NusA [Candidatus Parcubacteria bacterium]
MFDLKTINLVIDQLQEEKNISKEKIIEAIEASLATAYKKEYCRKSQFVRCEFDLSSGKTEFYQVKTAIDPEDILTDEDIEEIKENQLNNIDNEVFLNKIKFNDDQHILLATAQKIKKDIKPGEEIVFSLEHKDDFGRIAAQTAKQIIMQKIREAEKVNLVDEFGGKTGEIISGTVERIDRGSVFINVGKAIGVMPYDEQIKNEKFKQGERVRAYLVDVDDSGRGVFLKLSRSHPKFLSKLFELEVPEIKSGLVEIKSIAREAGSRSKVAVMSNDESIDPVGAMVGQRGSRVNVVMSELHGERIDIIEYVENINEFIERSLSPAKILGVDVDAENKVAHAVVTEDQQSLAIGKGGQNVRLAAKLTGYRIDIKAIAGDEMEEVGGQEEVAEEITN